jgi:multimeric flavodoxin WrbA
MQEASRAVAQQGAQASLFHLSDELSRECDAAARCVLPGHAL